MVGIVPFRLNELNLTAGRTKYLIVKNFSLLTIH